MKKLRVGIVGFGGIGHLHGSIYQNLPHCELVAATDPDPAKRAAETGDINLGIPARVDLSRIHAYADFETMVAAEKLDYVDIALPTDLHAEYTVRALEAGLHVFCEKPMARSVAEAERMLAAAHRAGRKLMIGQCLRFWPCYEVLIDAVRGGVFGPLRMLSMNRISVISRKPWMFDGRRSGGALFDMHLHDVDFANCLLGKPAAVTATACTRHTGAFDNVHAIYRYGAGITVAAQASWGATAFSMGYQAIFENAVMETIDNGAGVMIRRVGMSDEPVALASDTGHERELAYFTECILHDREPERCLPESTLDSLRIVTAEIVSAERNGAWIAL